MGDLLFECFIVKTEVFERIDGAGKKSGSIKRDVNYILIIIFQIGLNFD